nr:NnrS family protein [Rhizobium sp. Q54]
MTPRPADHSPAFLQTFFSGGFRPFFLFGALHAAVMIALWIPWFLGFIAIPTAFSPTGWHQHELLFGYVPAVIAGFLLTAVPNWTGRSPLSGWPLASLFGLWLAGRIAVSVSDKVGLPATFLIAGLFLPVLAALVLRELLAARNIRNYKVVAVLGLLTAAQVFFFYEFDRFGRSEASGRLAISAIILLIGVIGGRIIPAFTGNWLKQNNPGPSPVPFGRFDLMVMVLSGAALAVWTLESGAEPVAPAGGMLCLAAGALQFVRQLRWTPHRTLREPLVTILHAAFLFLPAGFLLTGAAQFLDDPGLRSAGIHAWTVGGIGTMTLAVMTRATRGHSGGPLHAPASTVLCIYVAIITASLTRIAAAIWPQYTMQLLPLAGFAWAAAFLFFAFLYAPLLLRPRRH